jgi:hypothetical protein
MYTAAAAAQTDQNRPSGNQYRLQSFSIQINKFCIIFSEKIKKNCGYAIRGSLPSREDKDIHF